MDADDWSGDEITCDVAWILIQGFVSGESTADGERLMRAHTERCGDCRDGYRGAVMTAARIGGEKRRERLEEERERRSRELRRHAFEATAPSTGRLHRMRTLLYPAFFAFLMFQVSRLSFSVDGVSVAHVAGEVRAAQVELEDRGEHRMARGEWCETGPDSSARLSAGDCSSLLGPASLLLIERASPLRFRLTRGSLDLDGSCTLSTEWGVLDLGPAQARVTISGAGLEVACLSGELNMTGPAGTTRMAAGTTSRFGAP